MALPIFVERRNNKRRELTGLLPGPLRMKNEKDSINCRPVDISKNGLGLLIGTELKPGIYLYLNLKNRDDIELLVTWVKPDFGKGDVFRHGLEVTNKEVDLEQLFLDSGCLISL